MNSQDTIIEMNFSRECVEQKVPVFLEAPQAIRYSNELKNLTQPSLGFSFPSLR